MNQLLLVLAGACLGMSVALMMTLGEGLWLGVTGVGLILAGWKQ